MSDRIGDKQKRTYMVVMADDDREDAEMTRLAFVRSGLEVEIKHVENGKKLIEFLRSEKGEEMMVNGRQKPAIVLLDLNMPIMDGREALQVIKRDAKLSKIPVVVLTSSRADEDVDKSYSLGANSYIAKPDTFTELTEVVKLVKNYWLGLVQLPNA